MPNGSNLSTPPSTAPSSPTSPTSTSGLVDCEKGNSLENGNETVDWNQGKCQYLPLGIDARHNIYNLAISKSTGHQSQNQILKLHPRLQSHENVSPHSVEASTNRWKTKTSPAK